MDFRRKPGEDTAELEQIRQLIRDLPEGEPDEYTVESIMAEERYAAVTTRRKRTPAPEEEEPSQDTRRISQIAREMKELARSGAGRDLRESQDVPANHTSPEPSGMPSARSEPEPEPFMPDERFAGTFSRPETEPDRPGLYTGDFDAYDGYEESRRTAGDLFKALKDYIRKPLPPLEAMPDQAYKRVAPYAASLRARTVLAFLFTLPLFYAALGPLLQAPMPDWLVYTRQPYRYLLVTGVSQVLIMLCAADVVARGLSDLIHLRPGAETLVTLSGLATILHVVTLLVDSAVFSSFIGFTPFTSVSGISFFFTLWAGFYQYNGYRFTYKTAMEGTGEAENGHARLITLEEDLWDGMSGYTKREGTLEGFVSRTETPDVSRRFSSLFAPLLMVAALVFATAASVGRGRPGWFFWTWSALSLATAPPCALFVFSLPFSRVAKRLSVKGGAVAGWTAARELKGGDFIAARDEDFFPPEMVSLNGLKIFNNHPYEKVTLYAAALLEASGSSLRFAVRELVRGREEMMPEINHVEYHESGGVSGEAGQDRILLGSSDFILHSGIRLPKELMIKKAVYLTVNLELAGIFAINYIPSNTTANAVLKLNRNSVTPLMAVRDFNITPALLKERYKLDADMFEYPTVEDRLALSDADRDTLERPSAFVTKDGISPIAECVIGALRLRRVAMINLWIYVVCTLASVLGMFYFVYTGTSEAALSVLPGNVLVYFLIWWIPVWICSAAAHRY